MLSGSLEENVLAMLCYSAQHAGEVALQIPADLFSTRAYRTIAEKAIAYVESYQAPAGVHLRDILEKECSRGDEGKLILATIEVMEKLFPSMQPQYILDNLSFFMRQQRMTQNAMAYADLVQKGKLDQAEALMHSGSTGMDMLSPGVWGDDPAGMLQFMDTIEEDYFSSGVDELDNRGVRPARGTMFLFIAPPKRGKSWFLIGCGKRALAHGQSVLHITLENSEKLTAKRYIQALFAMTRGTAGTIRTPTFVKDKRGRMIDISFNTLVPAQLNEASRAAVRKQLRGLKGRGRLLIKEFPMSSLSIGQLEAYLDMMDRKYDFRPDMLIVDYGDLMEVGKEEYRIALGLIFKRLRGIATKRNLALITATQGTRGSARAKTVGSDDVAEDYSKIGTADTIVTYSQTAKEKENNMARLLVAGARDAEDQYLVLISQSYATGQFCIDSVFLTSDVRQVTSRLFGEKDDGGRQAERN